MPASEESPAKICLICQQDCSDRRRLKDQSGHYYCRACLEAALKKKRDRMAHLAAPAEAMPAAHMTQQITLSSTATLDPPIAPPLPPVESVNHDLDLLNTLEKRSDPNEPWSDPTDPTTIAFFRCPQCHEQMPADAVVCRSCGYDKNTGQTSPENIEKAGPYLPKTVREQAATQAAIPPWLFWTASAIAFLIILGTAAFALLRGS